jgi:hypothetical protein
MAYCCVDLSPEKDPTDNDIYKYHLLREFGDLG